MKNTAELFYTSAMDIVLDEIEARVLGCLIEKEMTTPEYYPLSLNALLNACNQKSNRNPVLTLEEQPVLRALESLREKGLVRAVRAGGDRVSKYFHELFSRFDLSRQESAVLCDLMLRGPQTPGELRSNAGRMAPLDSLASAEEAIRALMEHDPPLVLKLAREPGRKESRYMHLLSGEIGSSPQSAASTSSVSGASGASAAPAVEQGEHDTTVAELKEEVARIRAELEELKREFEEKFLPND
jgi:uncharacterized protein YceH (UPF0502 family)